jgi:L-serine/L-threonine ammonia-lyase
MLFSVVLAAVVCWEVSWWVAKMLGGMIVSAQTALQNQYSMDPVPVVAMETHGSNCFYHSVSVNAGQFNSAKVLPQDVETWHDEGHNVSLARVKKLKSRASSLGASSPAPAVVKMALEREGGIKCVCVPDELAMQTNISFAGAFRLVISAPADRAIVEDHKMLVELACSVTLAPAYKQSLLQHLVPSSSTAREKTVVFIVCGGFKISLEELEEYREIVGADLKNGESWEVMCNGDKLLVEK